MPDKTEEATPRRLRKAREEGDSGVSVYGAQAFAFVVAVAVVPAAVRALASATGGDLRATLGALATGRRAALDLDAMGLATRVVVLAAPVLLAAGVAGAVASMIQTGGVVATGRLAPKLERLDPFAGLRNLLSTTRLFAVVRALVAGAVVGWLAWRGLRDHVVDVARVAGEGRGPWIPVVVAEVAGALAWRAGLVGLGLGLVDVLVTRTAWRRRLRMSKDEVRREHKDAEGDPQTKAARDRAYQELLAQATIANVRTASVVVVNPTHLATALRYDDAAGDEAPVVIAAGQGDVARGIVAAAEQHGVPVVQNVPLARTLAELHVGDVIPEALYEAVAELLSEIAARG